ncbi:GLIPR1-like protein 1 [Haliotis rubra]|uniref:GLIPR1-like protein 1 n=1 Tax=Haliotis rubra TaxID=36100 RepID=UPI001EE552F5|nr:GLIPR1-like protein 1 [Haliotis rubra]
MNFLGVAVLTVLTVACQGGVMKSNLQNLLLRIHNQGRHLLNDGRVSGQPRAGGIPDLTWDERLARKAKAWADGCQFKHTSAGEFGENLYMEMSQKPEEDIVVNGFQGWWDEVGQFNYNGASCMNTGSCHYSQVIWAETRKVGCAMKKCRQIPQMPGGKNIQYLVCFYDPKGNWYGEKPYQQA